MSDAQDNEAKGRERETNVTQLESFIASNSLEDARKELRRLLLAQNAPDDGMLTVGEALAAIVKTPTKNSLAGIILLRSLSVQGLVPEPNATNQITRHTVELCERSLPEIVNFLKIDARAQNYQKFADLSRCHQEVCALLASLALPYGDIDAMLNARKDIIGALNHSIVRQYGEPFRIKEIRGTVETLFAKIKKVYALEASLHADVNECNRLIAEVKSEVAGEPSFLSRDYLAAFATTCDRVLIAFVESLRGRFATRITRVDKGIVLQKRYPLHEPEREIQIAVPLHNSGPGIANAMRVTATSLSDSIVLSNGVAILGNISPGEFSVTVDAMIISPCDSFSALLNIEWSEIGNIDTKSETFEFSVVAQAKNIQWQDLEYWGPYSTSPVEGDKFIGRAEKVKQLAAKLLHDPMQPFYITGQKRVGKTSLALAAVQFAKSNRNGLLYHYILWGSVAHVDPHIAVRQLGESVESFIYASLPQGINLEKGDYNGSLAHLIKISNVALQVAPDLKFAIMLDEFDEIHQELFVGGNLAETFFANLRALARCKNICLILIGGENMPFIMDRQGQKLNNFARINLSYFSRAAEWDDFQLLVRRPTDSVLSWHDDAISEIFNITNGNPYFAAIICGGVLRKAISERDADITASEVCRATEAEVSALGANSFVHIWQDGIHKIANEREIDILRRMRVLVAIARCIRKNMPPNTSNIANSKTSQSMADVEIPAVLNDFCKRDVLRDDGLYRFVLPIFRMWLIDVGVSQLMADNLNEELANVAYAEENAAVVRSEEVVALAKSWPTYRGAHIGTDEIRAWYQQVDSMQDQRILFELLKRTRVYREAFVRERLSSAHAIVRRSLPEFIIRKRGERRTDVLVTYVDGEGKSGALFASSYAEENGISAACVVAKNNFASYFLTLSREHGMPAVVIIIDDIAATGKSLAENVSNFILESGDLLRQHDIKVRIVTLLATMVAQKAISKSLQKYDGIDIDFHSCEVLPEEAYAFPPNAAVWKNEEQEARAKALCTNLGGRIYKQSPLGYGGLGILIVFPSTVPNNSLPILHSYSKPSSGQTWAPLFQRIVN